MPALIEAAKRGVMLAGGMPMVFPTISIHESFAHPTSMYLRNLMAMDTDEMIRAQPMDAVIVIGGCDKNLPAQIMGAVSADLPTVVVPTGPMVVGHHRGEVLGACTDCRRIWAAHRAGEVDAQEIDTVNGRLAPSVGTRPRNPNGRRVGMLACSMRRCCKPTRLRFRFYEGQELGRSRLTLVRSDLHRNDRNTPAIFHGWRSRRQS